MGEHGEMKGHSVLLEKIEKINDNKIELTTYGAAVPDTEAQRCLTLESPSVAG
jgi:hypothetical protein